jgi:hypothetical protein
MPGPLATQIHGRKGYERLIQIGPPDKVVEGDGPEDEAGDKNGKEKLAVVA